ncbi:MAG TPA: fibronectin type III domain-containing protein [Actinoplanes sp.]|jgi:hypothetical protein
MRYRLAVTLGSLLGSLVVAAPVAAATPADPSSPPVIITADAVTYPSNPVTLVAARAEAGDDNDEPDDPIDDMDEPDDDTDDTDEDTDEPAEESTDKPATTDPVVPPVSTDVPVVPSPTTVPQTPRAPGTPTIGVATPGNGTATVRWTAPASDGGTPIYGYEVQVLDDVTGIAVAVDVAAADATQLTMTELRNGTTYLFWVRAMNAAGAGAFSAVSNPVVPVGSAVPPAPPGPPAPPRPATTRTAPGIPLVGAAAPGNGLAVLRWTAPADDGGSPITRYEVHVVDSATGAQIGGGRTATANATVLTLTGLSNGTAYRFRVRAVNAVGPGTLSPAGDAVTPRTVAGSPASVTGTPGAKGGAITATIRWTTPRLTGGAAVTGYRVTHQRLDAKGRATGSPTVVTLKATARATTYRAPSGVRADTRYRVTVQPLNAAGAGAGRTITTTVR